MSTLTYERRTPADSFTHFKALEAAHSTHLTHDGFHIVRLDGRAFSTYTRGLDAPFDAQFAAAMDTAAVAAAKEVRAVAAFVASDEISVVFTARTERSELPFRGQVAKVLSLTAALVTAAFNAEHFTRHGRLATFDARVVTVPGAADVLDYLVWRQADTYRNAVMMAARSMFSHRQMHGVGMRQARELVEGRTQTPFEDAYPDRFYLGRHVHRDVVTEPVTYTHSRTGEEHTVIADRAHWVAVAAPRYRELDPVAFASTLQH